jgi:DNA repair protein RadA/Sms
MGEVGLGGEVRQISNLKLRLSEASKLGFKSAIVPDNKLNISGLKTD